MFPLFLQKRQYYCGANVRHSSTPSKNIYSTYGAALFMFTRWSGTGHLRLRRHADVPRHHRDGALLPQLRPPRPPRPRPHPLGDHENGGY